MSEQGERAMTDPSEHASNDALQERIDTAKAELTALQVQCAHAQMSELQAQHSQGTLSAQAAVWSFFDDDKWIRVLVKHDAKSCKAFVLEILREYAAQVEDQRLQVGKWTQQLDEEIQNHQSIIFLKYVSKLSAMLDWFHDNLWFLPTTRTYPRGKEPKLLKWALCAFNKWYCQFGEYGGWCNDCELELLHALSLCGRLLKRELKASAGHTLEPTFLHDKKRLGWQPCNPKRQRIE